MSQYQLYGIGAALVDTEIDISDSELKTLGVEKGVMTLVDAERQRQLTEALSGHMVHAKLTSGGSACNSIVAASYFGARCFYSCKVANDNNGDIYLQDIRAAGVASNFDSRDRERGETGKCLVLISPDAERSMNTNLAISESLSVNELNEEALKNSELLYIEGYLVTSPSGLEAAVRARDIALANGVKTALSFSDPGMVEFFRDGMASIVGDGLDLIFCNEAEALQWAGTDNLEAAFEAMKSVAAGFAITLGAKGALLWDGKEKISISPVAVKAVDTNGAGDMFAGAFLAALSQGHDFSKAGELGCRAAAEVVSGYGPRLAPERHAGLIKEVLAS